jgi:hypothetical protein
MKKLDKVFLLVFSMFLSACSTVKPLPKPHPLTEYQHPYVIAPTHQVESVGVTQQVVENSSDVVLIQQGQEYVYWTSGVNTLRMSNEQAVDNIIEENVVEVVLEQAIQPFFVDETLVEPARTCKKIFCDDKNEEECGAIAWCDGDYCPKDKWLESVYDCSGDDCVAKFVQIGYVNLYDCDNEAMDIHPQCLGKGSQACVVHPELFYCNNLARECKE